MGTENPVGQDVIPGPGQGFLDPPDVVATHVGSGQVEKTLPVVHERRKLERISVDESGVSGLELGLLEKVVVPQGVPDPLQEVGPGDPAAILPEMLAEVIGKDPVDRAVNGSVRSRLVLPAGGPENMALGGPVDRPESPGLAQGRDLALVPGDDVIGGREISDFPDISGLTGRVGGGRPGAPGAGARVATVEDHLQQGVVDGRQGLENPVEIVVPDKPAVPAHVRGAEDLVHPVGKLVPVSIPDLGAVPGEIEDHKIPRPGQVDHQPEAMDDVLSGGPAVDQDPDVLIAKPQIGPEQVPDVADIVDAATEPGLPLVFVDAHQQRSSGHDPSFI